MHFEELMKNMTEFLKTEAKTDTVIGEAFKLGEFTCVPVIKVGFGFGTGGGEGVDQKKVKGQGMGGGAGMGIEPIGFLVTKDENISFLESGKAHGLAAAFEKVPELIDKWVDRKEREKETEMA